MIKAVHFKWTRIQKSSQDECWPWIGAKNRYGYGACQYMGKQMNASRAAFIESNGLLEDGLVVCHHCDNPACCNPAHLFAATQAENNEDCRKKGRHRVLSGDDHPRPKAKLTPEMVETATKLYADGISQSEIARRWGLHSSVISRAVRRKTWRNVCA